MYLFMVLLDTALVHHCPEVLPFLKYIDGFVQSVKSVDIIVLSSLVSEDAGRAPVGNLLFFEMNIMLYRGYVYIIYVLIFSPRFAVQNYY